MRQPNNNIFSRIWKSVCFYAEHRNYFLKKYSVHRTARLEKRSFISLGEHCEIQEYVIIRPDKNKVAIGRFSQINPFVVIYGGSGVIIGDHVMVGPHTMIASGTHNHTQLEVPMRFAVSESKGPIVIEDDVWIGANCTITDGVRIGKGSVVGANSVVIHDVNPYDVVAGVPAKFIKNRKDGNTSSQN